jgi:diaminohydroxyphosphoribosylaminopyrimidine deaminase / 5-amino-6-(5-phosphoribosylamino)uracil reductase
MSKHEKYMDLALSLARSAQGQTAPNPMVGAVVVKDGEIVGMGAHLKAGSPHAEVHALRMAGEKTLGATIYVTLEPCSHHGRTPPCADALIKAGIAEVVVAALDPNPLVAGRGIEKLKAANINVLTGIREKEARQMNEVFNKFITTGKPFVTIKTAMTLDGKVATFTGSSRWITGDEARGEVHQLRHENEAILVGIGTVLEDNPKLTTRLPEGGRNPLRIVLDSSLRVPLEAEVVNVQEAKTWIYTTERADMQKIELLQAKGVRVIILTGQPSVNIEEMLAHLGQEGVSSLLVEGGSEVNGSFLQAKAADKMITYIAPKIVGGRNAPSPFGGQGVEQMNEAVPLLYREIKQVGQDFCIIGYPDWGERDVYRNH